MNPQHIPSGPLSRRRAARPGRRLRGPAALVSVTLLALPLASGPAAAAGLDPQESAMVNWVDAHTGEATQLLEDLVDINSGTMNVAGVRQVGARLAREFDAVGFETQWMDRPGATGRAGDLFARHLGDRGRKVLLIGHLDTVFEPGDSFQKYSRDGDMAHGPGVSDMKSGDVVILYAIKALAAVGALEGSQVVVAYTGDEESPGKPLAVSRRDLIAAGKWADVALGFEEGIQEDGKEWVTVARRSSSEWLLDVTGRQAHSAGIFSEDVGAGAIFEAARILDGFYDEVRGERYLTFNAGSIVGGTEVQFDPQQTRGSAFGKTNVVPSHVVVQGGLRTISPEQTKRARDAMQQVVSRHLPHTDATLSFADGYPPMPPTEGNLRLQEMLSDINVALGRQPMPAFDPGRRGAADISFVAPYTDALAGLGPYGSGAHTPQEALDLTSFPVAIKRAALLLYRLSRAGTAPGGPAH